MNLLDASAFLNLCSRGRVGKLSGSSILSLTWYEVGNAIWKQVRRGRMSEDLAREFLETVLQVMANLEVLNPSNWLKILDIALEESLSFYDASYIQVARERDLRLVTDDKRLYEVARRYVEVARSEEI